MVAILSQTFSEQREHLPNPEPVRAFRTSQDSRTAAMGWREVTEASAGAPSVRRPSSAKARQSAGNLFQIKRGTNISHWLSQSRRRGQERQAWFTREDVKFLAKVGFDHLRIPIDEEQMWNEEGEKEREAFQLLHDVLDWCAEFSLAAIVDLHILRSHHFNEARKALWTDPKAQERFFQCWRDLSGELKDRSTRLVAYELLNEPVAENPEDWNQLLGRALAVVRSAEPGRVIFIGSNRWQSATTFDRLVVPSADPLIFLSFHLYEPFALTHHRAGWTSIRHYQGPVRYPGMTVDEKDLAGLPKALVLAMRPYARVFDRRSLVDMIQKPLDLARRTGLPLYCGEWGCLPTAPKKDRLRWYEDVRSVFDENGIAWATWDYKGNFGVVDRAGKPEQDLLRVLLR
jgi:endoglucanase